MSSKTKIIVLRMKEVVYTGLFAGIGLLLILLLLLLFLPGRHGGSEEGVPAPTPSLEPSGKPEDITGNELLQETSGILQEASGNPSSYLPGIYKTELVLGGQTIEIEVILQKDSITSARLVNMDDAVNTMYPLLEPAMEHICSQVCEKQSTENITYSAGTKYTSLVLLEAIRSCIEKGSSPSEQ